MCGIVGFNHKDGQLITRMASRLSHRGPDDQGIFTDDFISLGHRRLSILDLSERGTQPMKYKNFIIIYNGEIYNFAEIKTELEKKGHEFTTQTDTEVILHAYSEWGSECVQKFNGMWAFCIYNRIEKKLFLSRDRFGIKPLYYFWDGKHFIFASEIKAIRESGHNFETDREALNFYFFQKYVGNNKTIYKQIYKLRPSENLIFHLQDNRLEFQQYYDLIEHIKSAELVPPGKRLERIGPLIEDAVQKRLVSDVPVGSFLSGGVDSSLISAIIARNKKDFDTFSIGFRQKSYSELDYSILVSEYIKTRHHYEMMDIQDTIIESVFKQLDEPFGDASILPTFLLSQLTRKYVTVSLSGDAGDEIFGGYDTYLGYKISAVMPRFVSGLINPILNRIPDNDKKVNFVFRVKRFFRDLQYNPMTRHLNWMGTFTESSRKNLLSAYFQDIKFEFQGLENQNLLNVQLCDVFYYMVDDILRKVDTASMLHSLEVRVPFLDHRLVPLVLSLPDSYKIRYFRTKYLLKKIAAAYLPKEIPNRKKRGFTVPISQFVKNSPLIEAYLKEKGFYAHGYYSREYVQELYKQHASGGVDYARELWLIFVFNYWYSSQSNII